jgi:hypothetical protein
MRFARLDAAVGDDVAADVDRDEHLGCILRMLDGYDRCRCGDTIDPLARNCATCGRATFSPYATAKRAARVPLEPEHESPQIARSA